MSNKTFHIQCQSPYYYIQKRACNNIINCDKSCSKCQILKLKKLYS